MSWPPRAGTTATGKENEKNMDGDNDDDDDDDDDNHDDHDDDDNVDDSDGDGRVDRRTAPSCHKEDNTCDCSSCFHHERQLPR